MDKKDILSRAQKGPDEMEVEVSSKALGISTLVIPLICLIFIIMRIVRNNYIVSDLVVTVLAQLLIQEIYQYMRMRKKRDLILILITFILTIVFLIGFINEVSLWIKN